MPISLSMLRGINLGAHKKVPMPALKALYESLNFKNVSTYIQSGNVVFEHDDDLGNLADKLAQSIATHFGFEVPVVIRTLAEMQAVRKENPFLKEANIEAAHLHVTFLAEIPEQTLLDKIQTFSAMPDEFRIVGKTIYLHCPNGYGRTKLTNNFFEQKLKLTATTRNWKTVNELTNMMEAASKL